MSSISLPAMLKRNIQELYSDVPTQEVVGTYVNNAIHSEDRHSYIVTEKSREYRCTWWPGHHMSAIQQSDGQSGPLVPVRVMMVGPYPKESFSNKGDFGETDTMESVVQYCFSPYEPCFRSWCDEAGISDYNDWYFTNLLKFAPIFDMKGDFKVGWVSDGMVYLEEELKVCQPEWILIFGTQTAKALLKRRKVAVHSSLNSVYQWRYRFSDGTVKDYKVIVLPSTDGMDLATTPTEMFKSQLNFFHRVRNYQIALEDIDPGTSERLDVHTAEPTYSYIWDIESLRGEINRIKELAVHNQERRIIAVDMEWEGAYPDQPGAHLLTVQFSSWPGEAAVVVLHSSERGEVMGYKPVAKELSKLLTWQPVNEFDPKQGPWSPRVGGHFLRADLHWLYSLGIKGPDEAHTLLDSYRPPDRLTAEPAPKDFTGEDLDLWLWSQEQRVIAGELEPLCKYEGGWDTSLMYHAYSEKANFGLKDIAKLELDAPAYEADLQACINRYLSDNSMKVADLNGFGCVPDEILHPYGAKDADYTRTLAKLCMVGIDDRPALLDSDAYGNNSWVPYWRAHRASPGFLEIEQVGINLDVERFKLISRNFTEGRKRLLAAFRRKIRWSTFNPSSTEHKRYVLFGPEHGCKRPTSAPEDAVSFGLTPEYATKDRLTWSRAVAEMRKGTGVVYEPSTDKTTLSILSQSSEDAGMLQDICILDHNLSQPMSVVEVGAGNIDGKGFCWYERCPKGLLPYRREDGKIHTGMSQMMATGRASSSKPPLQNIGKSVEESLAVILGTPAESKDGTEDWVCTYKEQMKTPLYTHPMKTVFTAAPGHVFLEADFTGAELAVMAWISGDENMIEHVRRNALSEDDPDFYDIHSHIAVQAFHLDCEPTKKGLASIHKKHLRVAAKSVVFGIPYGRGAAALALECKSKGAPITADEAKGLINTYFASYPKVRDFLNDCKNRISFGSSTPYVCNLFGRYRRFPRRQMGLVDADLIAAWQREACNAPIQGTVADAINVAMYNLLHYRRYAKLVQHRSMGFRIVMQIHDALLLEIPIEELPEVLDWVFPQAMTARNPIITVGSNGPVIHHFGVDVTLYARWGEKLTDTLAQQYFNATLDEVKKGIWRPSVNEDVS